MISKNLRKLTLVIAVAGFIAGPAFSVETVHKPPKGSKERKAILDGMRARGDGGGMNHIYKVKVMKVAGNWAWILVDPSTADGKNHFESEEALLQKMGAHWKVVAQPCAEVDCVAADEIAKIKKKFPAAPEGIFPE